MKTRRVRVIYSYNPQNSDELELRIDDIIDVLDVVEQGWWKGLLRGKIGVFPSNFVEEVKQDNMETILSSSTTTTTSSLSKSDLDLDQTEIIKDNCNDEVLQIIPKKIGGVPTALRLGVGSRSVLRPIDDKRDRLLPKKPPPPAPAIADSDVPAPKLPPKPAREQARVLFAYESQNEDELTIKEGDIITIINKEIEDQGWWKGELNGKIGVFPDNFVELIKSTNQDMDLPPRKKLSDPKSHELKSVMMISSHSPPVIKKQFNKDSVEEKPSFTSSAINPTTTMTLSSSPTSTGSVSLNLQAKKIKENGEKCKSFDQNDDHSLNNHNHQQQQQQHHFGAIETKSPLKHLTANRAKGPKDRRPPSMIGLPSMADEEASLQERDEQELLNHQNESNNHIINNKGSSEHISNKPVNQAVTTTTTTTPQQQQQQQPVQWMLELKKKNEEKRKAAIVDETKALSTPNSPTKISSNRLSGDFSHKSFLKDQQQPSQQPITQHVTENNHLPTVPSKPLKAAKPGIGNALTAINTKPTGNAIKVYPESITHNSSVETTNCATPTTTTTTTTATATATISEKELSDLRNELKHLKETTVSRVEFESLQKEIKELREIIELQKQSYSSNIKDLINDSAESRMKLATLQIEVDRLRRLTTTV